MVNLFSYPVFSESWSLFHASHNSHIFVDTFLGIGEIQYTQFSLTSAVPPIQTGVYVWKHMSLIRKKKTSKRENLAISRLKQLKNIFFPLSSIDRYEKCSCHYIVNPLFSDSSLTLGMWKSVCRHIVYVCDLLVFNIIFHVFCYPFDAISCIFGRHDK